MCYEFSYSDESGFIFGMSQSTPEVCGITLEIKNSPFEVGKGDVIRIHSEA